MYAIRDTEKMKAFASKGYNYVLDRTNGHFMRCGETLDDDPQYSPFGCEILDLEISVNQCSGKCPMCYKSNVQSNPRHMSAETVRQIMEKMPATLYSVDLGLTDLDANPDLIEIMDVIKSFGVTPTFTTSGLGVNPELARECASRVGALAVSCYEHLGKDVCYDTVKLFTDLGVEQTNIHLLYHSGNMDFVKSVFQDALTDSRLENLNCIVLLGLKQKGRGKNLSPANKDSFESLVKYAFENDVRLGFDSCSAHRFLSFVKSEMPKRQDLIQSCEPCESSCFSIYVDVDGIAWPCSFCEGISGYADVLNCDDFVKDVWYSPGFVDFRNHLLANGRKCPVYEV